MKKIRFAIMLLLSFCWLTSAEAQVVDVPGKAKDHFFKKYPDAKNADWNNNVVSYSVKFELNKETYRAYYHMDGNWDYSEKYMDQSQLPATVKDSFSKCRYADWKVKSYSWIENNNGKQSYRVEVEKGIEQKAVFFDKNGKEVKSSKAM